MLLEVSLVILTSFVSSVDGGGGIIKAEISSNASLFSFHWSVVSGGGGTVIFSINESISLN